MNTEHINVWFARVDAVLDTRKKRHMVGGVLISISALLSGLAITIMTLKEDKV